MATNHTNHALNKAYPASGILLVFDGEGIRHSTGTRASVTDKMVVDIAHSSIRQGGSEFLQEFSHGGCNSTSTKNIEAQADTSGKKSSTKMLVEVKLMKNRSQTRKLEFTGFLITPYIAGIIRFLTNLSSIMTLQNATKPLKSFKTPS